MKRNKRLSELSLGESGVVSEMLLVGGMQRRLLDIGLIRGTKVLCVGRSPLGDPMLFSVRGANIAIRKSDASGVIIE